MSTQKIKITTGIEKKPSKYRQGRGWVVTWYDEHLKVWRVSNEVDYWQAICDLRKLMGDTR